MKRFEERKIRYKMTLLFILCGKKVKVLFFLLLRFPLGRAADHLVCPESPFEHNKDVWTLGVKIKGESSAFSREEASIPMLCIQIFFLKFVECFLGIIIKIHTNLFSSKCKCKVGEYEATPDDVIQDVAIWKKWNHR